jgi:hypothetical protein
MTVQDQEVRHLFSPKQFCARNNTSITTFYELLKTGRLRALKQGRLTFVTSEEEARYRASLPPYVPNGRSAA